MSAEIDQVNMLYLTSMCESNLAAKLLLETFASRQNNSWKSSIDVLQKALRSRGYNFSEAEIRRCCKGFQEAGCGTLRRAYKERKSQFEWKYSSIQISRAVLKNQLNVN